MKYELDWKAFLLNESKEYFSQKISSIQNGIQDISEDSANMGSRHLTRLVLTIVNQIRQVLHNEWSAQERPYLEKLQRVGVALMKAIDEKGDLPGTLKASAGEIQKILDDLGVPQNNIGSEPANTPGS